MRLCCPLLSADEADYEDTEVMLAQVGECVSVLAAQPVGLSVSYYPWDLGFIFPVGKVTVTEAAHLLRRGALQPPRLPRARPGGARWLLARLHHCRPLLGLPPLLPAKCLPAGSKIVKTFLRCVCHFPTAVPLCGGCRSWVAGFH